MFLEKGEICLQKKYVFKFSVRAVTFDDLQTKAVKDIAEKRPNCVVISGPSGRKGFPDDLLAKSLTK